MIPETDAGLGDDGKSVVQVAGKHFGAGLLNLGGDLVAVVGHIGNALDDHIVGLPLAFLGLAERVVEQARIKFERRRQE